MAERRDEAGGLSAGANAFDVVVLGAGPAGSSAAVALLRERPQLRVALVEASAYGEARVGETLAPGGRAILEGLGCWSRVRAHAIESYGTSAAWGEAAPYDSEFLFGLRGTGWRVDRASFDAALAGCAADAGAMLFTRARFAGVDEHEKDAVGVVVRDDGGEHTLQTRAVIDGTGRSGVFASRMQAEREVLDELTGAAMLFRLPAGRGDETTFVEAAEDGWWYSAAVPGGTIVAVWMSDADVIRRDAMRDADRWQERLRASPLTAARLAGCVPRSDVIVRSARSQRLLAPCGERWVAVGDAASTFDPLSGAGMFKALLGGKLGAFTVLNMLDGDERGRARYRAIIDREWSNYCAARAWYYGLERRWPRSVFWSRRQAVQVAEAR